MFVPRPHAGTQHLVAKMPFSLCFVCALQEGEAAFVHRHKHVGYELHKDVPGRTLADADSKFIHCNGLDVHYKEAFPEVGATCTIVAGVIQAS